MAFHSGPGQFTFDEATGALLTTGGGGGGTQDVNITEILGNPVAPDNPLYVELTNGTDPISVSNPLFVDEPPSQTANAPSAQALTSISQNILASNMGRLQAIVQNVGTTVVYLGLGQTPNTVSYHIALSACTLANDGTGGVFVSDVWKGDILAIVSASGTVVVTELTA